MNKEFYIAVCPGHHRLNKGTIVNGIVEHEENIFIADKLCDFLGNYEFIKTKYIENTLREKVNKINKLDPDICLDLHLNSSENRNVEGTETLHSGSSQSVVLADKIHQELLACLELKDRGIKLGRYLGISFKPILYFLRKTICPAVITEPLFISNKNDLEVLNHEVIAEAIGLGIISYIQEVGEI